jgi:hypothetical protein
MDNNMQPQEDRNVKATPTSLIDRIYGERKDLLQKLLTIVSIIFFILVPIELIYNVITGIVYYGSFSSNYMSTEIKISFVSYLVKALTAPAVYAFYGLVLAVLKRIISK